MLKTKLLKNLYLIYTVLVASSLIFLNIVLFTFTNSREADIFDKQVETIKSQLIHDLNQADEKVSLLSEQFYREPNIILNFYKFSTNSYSQYQSYLLDLYISNPQINISSVDTFFNSLLLSSPSISSISLYSNSLDRMTIFQNYTGKNSHYTVRNIDGLFNIHFTNENTSIEDMLYTMLTTSEYDFPFKYDQIMPLNHPYTYKNFGFLIISQNINSLKNINVNLPYPTVLSLHDQNNNLLSKFEYMKDSTYESYSKKSILFSIPWGNTDLTLTAEIRPPKTYNNLIGFYILSFLLSIVLFVILLLLFRLNLHKLDKLFEEILTLIKHGQSGDLTYRIPIKVSKNNELTLIADQLNKMNSQLDEHIKSVYIAETKQKEAYIMALQNQVNPHFLYNTLEVIRTNALKHGNREVGNQLSSLSRLHRNLVKGDPHVTLRTELEFCRSYIEIQGLRYNNNFTYKFNCAKNTMHYLVPKFILQPIIENYFKHGFISNNDDNMLTVTSYFKDDLLKIIIYNNGQAFNEDKLKYIDNILESDNYNHSIGLSNIHQRISLEYGPEYGLKILPSKEKGVSFLLEFPRKGLRDNHEDTIC